jgi:hypothetical protein
LDSAPSWPGYWRNEGSGIGSEGRCYGMPLSLPRSGLVQQGDRPECYGRSWPAGAPAAAAGPRSALASPPCSPPCSPSLLFPDRTGSSSGSCSAGPPRGALGAARALVDVYLGDRGRLRGGRSSVRVSLVAQPVRRGVGRLVQDQIAEPIELREVRLEPRAGLVAQLERHRALRGGVVGLPGLCHAREGNGTGWSAQRGPAARPPFRRTPRRLPQALRR